MKRVTATTRSSARIAEDLARTQTRIDATLDELTRRLRPTNLAREAAKSLVDAAGRTSNGIAQRLGVSGRKSENEPTRALVSVHPKAAAPDASKSRTSKSRRKAVAIGAAGVGAAVLAAAAVTAARAGSRGKAKPKRVASKSRPPAKTKPSAKRAAARKG